MSPCVTTSQGSGHATWVEIYSIPIYLHIWIFNLPECSIYPFHRFSIYLNALIYPFTEFNLPEYIIQSFTHFQFTWMLNLDFQITLFWEHFWIFNLPEWSVYSCTDFQFTLFWEHFGIFNLLWEHFWNFQFTWMFNWLFTDFPLSLFYWMLNLLLVEIFKIFYFQLGNFQKHVFKKR